ncbi:RNA exonuclease ngl2, partial [Tilletia horrida]
DSKHRFEVHSTALRHHGYAYEYQRGYRVKKHDLAIVWRTIARPGSPGAVFAAEPAGRALLYFDHACVSDGDPRDASGRRRTACSRETRNIALFVAIRFADRKGGLIVATTHTFWHPKHGYERARQVGLIIRELDKFRRRKGAEWQDWDCVLAG